MKIERLFWSLRHIGLCAVLFTVLSCGNELHITMPPGPQGPAGSDGLSAYELWKAAVEDGTIEWDVTRTDLVDFFIYLKGEKGEDGRDGTNGKSAYELWVEEVLAGNVTYGGSTPGGGGPDSGTPWPSDKTEMWDFWEYLSGADGKNGTTPTIGENGNWWIGDTDTGVPARGQDGGNGQDGENGSVVTIVGGFWYIDGVNTEIPVNGKSAYELWVEEVAIGLVNPHAEDGSEWPKDKTSLLDFWEYLRGARGPRGFSAYEVWKAAVENGTIEWDKDRTELVDFFVYLKGDKGDDGIDGKSAYEVWVEQVAAGNIYDKDGVLWPGDATSMADFWKYLSGADGKNGTTPTIGENGNWWIGSTDTGVPARGRDGDNGSVVTIVGGFWHIDGKNTGVRVDGLSAYELWVEAVMEGLVNPHAEDGSNWPEDEIDLQDFWEYLRGAQGEQGLSAYEVWKEAVEDGTIVWNKKRTDLVDYFVYLKGEKGDDGKDGKSAYELWAEQVLLGLVWKDGERWPVYKITMRDFWEYLSGADGKNGLTPDIKGGYWWIGDNNTGVKARGEDGDPGADGSVVTIVGGYWYIDGENTGVPVDGLSAYELWVEAVTSEDGLLNPHAEDGSDWPTDETSLADFWRYLRGVDGQDGECNCPTPPKFDFLQPMAKRTISQTLTDELTAREVGGATWANFWVAKSSYAAYEGFVFEPALAAVMKDANLVTGITIPFWRQRIEFTLTSDGSPVEVLVVGQNDLEALDSPNNWVDGARSDVEFDLTEPVEEGDNYTQKIRLSFEANDLPGEQFREMTLMFRKVDEPTSYKLLKVRQVYLPNMLSRYSKANVAELNSFGTEITESNFATLTPAQRGYHYQWGRNVPIKTGETYSAATVPATSVNIPAVWDKSVKFNYGHWVTASVREIGYTWVQNVAAATGAPASYVGTNGGDPCPEGWHLPNRAEIYSFAIGQKTTGGADYFRFNTPYTNENAYEIGTLFDSDCGIRWGYWWKRRAYASIHTTGTGTGTATTFANFNSMYAVKFRSQSTYDVYENALKGAFKYELLDNGSGQYYAKISYRHLGEKSDIVSASDIQGTFWDSNNENDVSVVLPLYGYADNYAQTAYNNINGYYPTSELRRFNPFSGQDGIAAITLFIGGPGDTGNSGERQTMSGEWSYGTSVGGMLRCIRNPQEPEIPGTTTSLPAWK